MANNLAANPGKNRLRSIKSYAPLAPVRDAAMQEAACQLLQQALPGNWVLHLQQWDDQGSDCLLEIVEEGPFLDGCSACIRLLVVNGVRWNPRQQYRSGPVRPPCAYRHVRHPYPVFLFLADMRCDALHFLCTETYIQAHFDTYLHKGRLSYRFDQERDFFSYPNGHLQLGACILAHQERQELENLLTLTLTNPAIRPGEVPDAFSIPDLLQQVRALLHGPLAYWSFTNRAVYYYLHALHQQLQQWYTSGQTPSSGLPSYRPYPMPTIPLQQPLFYGKTSI